MSERVHVRERGSEAKGDSQPENENESETKRNRMNAIV